GARALAGLCGVPCLAERASQARLLVLVALPEPIALGGQRFLRGGLEPARLRLLERLLDLEHLLEQLGRRLGLHGRALTRVAALLEAHQVLDPRERIAQRPLRGVEARGGVEEPPAARRRRALAGSG